MPLGTRWGVEVFTASHWDGLTPKDPINVVFTGRFSNLEKVLLFLREEVRWGRCLGSTQFLCQVQPVNAHRNDAQLASGFTTVPKVDRHHVRVYLTDETTDEERVVVAPAHHDHWTRHWTRTRGGWPIPAWEVAHSFVEARDRVEAAAKGRSRRTWVGNRLAVRQANGEYVAGDGWALCVRIP